MATGADYITSTVAALVKLNALRTEWSPEETAMFQAIDEAVHELVDIIEEGN